MNLQLIEANVAYKDQIIDFLEECFKSGERIIPTAIAKEDYHDFDKYCSFLNRRAHRVEKDRVPATIYFTVDLDRDIVVGSVDIRHYLNDALLVHGGHIGDGVRPSERRKGIATAQIKLALDKCKELGIKNVLMTCEKWNVGSAKSIINNGGVLENEVDFEGKTFQRYWIKNNFTLSDLKRKIDDYGIYLSALYLDAPGENSQIPLSQSVYFKEGEWVVESWGERNDRHENYRGTDENDAIYKYWTEILFRNNLKCVTKYTTKDIIFTNKKVYFNLLRNRYNDIGEQDCEKMWQFFKYCPQIMSEFKYFLINHKLVASQSAYKINGYSVESLCETTDLTMLEAFYCMICLQMRNKETLKAIENKTIANSIYDIYNTIQSI